MNLDIIEGLTSGDILKLYDDIVENEDIISPHYCCFINFNNETCTKGWWDTAYPARGKRIVSNWTQAANQCRANCPVSCYYSSFYACPDYHPLCNFPET